MGIIIRLLTLMQKKYIHGNILQSKSIKGLKRMIVRIKHNCSNLYIPYIRVILDSDANASPYTRTSQKTLERQRTLLTQGHSVHETYDLLIKESGGPYASSSQSAGPCNKCQLYNVNLKRRRQIKWCKWCWRLSFKPSKRSEINGCCRDYHH